MKEGKSRSVGMLLLREERGFSPTKPYVVYATGLQFYGVEERKLMVIKIKIIVTLQSELSG